MDDILIAEYDFEFDEPIVATAIHNGHDLSSCIAANMALSDPERLYEEDPHTGYFTKTFRNCAIVNVSRFQTDLNRQASHSYYLLPKHAWGLQVRKNIPSIKEIDYSLAGYAKYYNDFQELLNSLLKKYERVFVYDIHSYNHQRQGKGKPFDDPALNPEIIIGTNNMPEKWLPLADRIVVKLKEGDYFGRQLDVRKNVKFDGGHFSRWLHDHFKGRVGCIALEFKKIFMDEWSGEVDWVKAERLRDILGSTKKTILDFL